MDSNSSDNILSSTEVIFLGIITSLLNFYCNEKKAIIELDGPIHNNNGEYDLFRDSELKHLGYNILRLKNEELNDIKSTKARILAFLDSINEE